jgi:hypothetical protein
VSVELPVGRIVGVNHRSDAYPAEVLGTHEDEVILKVLVDLPDGDGDVEYPAGLVVVIAYLFITHDDLAAEAPEMMPVTVRQMDVPDDPAKALLRRTTAQQATLDQLVLELPDGEISADLFVFDDSTLFLRLQHAEHEQHVLRFSIGDDGQVRDDNGAPISVAHVALWYGSIDEVS